MDLVLRDGKRQTALKHADPYVATYAIYSEETMTYSWMRYLSSTS